VGQTIPGGHGFPAARGRSDSNARRFVTWKPRTGSAGYEAHHATKALVIPASPRMFHSAFTLRKREVIGTRRPLGCSIAWKSATPCRSGPTPVTIVVQSSGEIIGSYERSGPCTPSAISFFRRGMRPSRTSGSMRSQSAPSSPMSSTRNAVGSRAGMAPPA